jgi:hypothetical protein
MAWRSEAVFQTELDVTRLQSKAPHPAAPARVAPGPCHSRPGTFNPCPCSSACGAACTITSTKNLKAGSMVDHPGAPNTWCMVNRVDGPKQGCTLHFAFTCPAEAERQLSLQSSTLGLFRMAVWGQPAGRAGRGDGPAPSDVGLWDHAPAAFRVNKTSTRE